MNWKRLGEKPNERGSSNFFMASLILFYTQARVRGAIEMWKSRGCSVTFVCFCFVLHSSAPAYGTIVFEPLCTRLEPHVYSITARGDDERNSLIHWAFCAHWVFAHIIRREVSERIRYARARCTSRASARHWSIVWMHNWARAMPE